MYESLKQKVWQACQMLPAAHLAILTWGNASAVDRGHGVVAIKPSGVDYARMRPEDIVVCDLEGRILEGSLNPSSDLPTHLELYRAWPQIKAIVHTHSTWATLQAQTGRDLIPWGTTHADSFYGAVPCTRPLRPAEISGEYERETGKVIAETFRARGLDPLAVPAILVARHGPFTWGDTPAQAVQTAMVLEQCAQMAVLDELLCHGEAAVDQALLDRHYHRKHGPNATYGQH